MINNCATLYGTDDKIISIISGFAKLIIRGMEQEANSGLNSIGGSISL
jgi:hypothetical protein